MSPLSEHFPCLQWSALTLSTVLIFYFSCTNLNLYLYCHLCMFCHPMYTAKPCKHRCYCFVLCIPSSYLVYPKHTPRTFSRAWENEHSAKCCWLITLVVLFSIWFPFPFAFSISYCYWFSSSGWRITWYIYLGNHIPYLPSCLSETLSRVLICHGQLPHNLEAQKLISSFSHIFSLYIFVFLADKSILLSKC